MNILRIMLLVCMPSLAIAYAQAPLPTTALESLDEFANTSVVTEVEYLRHNNLAFALEFKEPVVLSDMQERGWSEDLKAPFITHTKRWLNALDGIAPITNDKVHTISFTIAIFPTHLGDGLATAREFSTRGEYTLPTRGALLISGYAYHDDGTVALSQKEFDATILHELGHIFGFNDMLLPHLGVYTEFGFIFDVDGHGAQAYREVYHVPFPFVPLSDDRGHLYDFVYGKDEPRTRILIPLAPELMAHGYFLGRVTLGMLKDLGYTINYDYVDEYTLKKPRAQTR